MPEANLKVYTRNSIYEIDHQDNYIRRVNSNHQPTERQEKDGVWQEYATIPELDEGSPMMICWEETENQDYIEATRTSTVQKIISL